MLGSEFVTKLFKRKPAANSGTSTNSQDQLESIDQQIANIEAFRDNGNFGTRDADDRRLAQLKQARDNVVSQSPNKQGLVRPQTPTIPEQPNQKVTTSTTVQKEVA